MAPLSRRAVRPGRHRSLDEAVAVEVAGYRWVEWNHEALRGAPLDRPGRFLAREDEPLAHLHVPAREGVPPSEEALAHVPHYALVADDAWRAVEASGLLDAGEVSVARSGDGRWRVRVAEALLEASGEGLAAALCTAALGFVRRSRAS